MAIVLAVSVTPEKGRVVKNPGAIILTERGVTGDFHVGRSDRQVSVLPIEAIERCAAEAGKELGPGSFAENITSRGLDVTTLGLGDRLTAGEVLLEVTMPCHRAQGEVCSLHGPVERFIMRQDGVFCRVVSGGQIRPGDALERVPAAD